MIGRRPLRRQITRDAVNSSGIRVKLDVDLPVTFYYSLFLKKKYKKKKGVGPLPHSRFAVFVEAVPIVVAPPAQARSAAKLYSTALQTQPLRLKTVEATSKR